MTYTLTCEDNFPESGVKLSHYLLFRSVEVNVDAHKDEVHFLFSSTKYAYLLEYFMVLNHEYSVAHTWGDESKKFFHFILTLKRGSASHYFVPHILF